MFPNVLIYSFTQYFEVTIVKSEKMDFRVSCAIRRISLRVVGGSSHPKTALINQFRACSIVFMSGEHADHSSRTMSLS